MRCFEKAPCSWSAVLLSLALMPAWVYGQGIEAEPNNPCTSAQDFGDTGLPFDVSGNLDWYDVDFFRFQAVAGQEIVADLEGSWTGQGTLSDPYLGLFDSSCNLVASDDDGGSGTNARLLFTVATDGIFTFAASACCDVNFDGTHWDYGTYTLTIATAPELSSISGRVLDGFTGDPLQNAFVELRSCWDELCTLFDVVSWETTNAQGEFVFFSTYWGSPIPAGTYQVWASAFDYQPGSSDIFELLEGQDVDIGDILLQGPPVRFSDIQPCEYVPAIGGECEYSVRITNGEPALLKGGAWSLITATQTGSYLGYTEFQAEDPERLRLDPGASTEVEFEFDVPGSVPQGTYICPDIWVGVGLREPYFFTVGTKDPLFCIYKGIADTYTLIAGGEAESIARQLDAQRSPREYEPKK